MIVAFGPRWRIAEEFVVWASAPVGQLCRNCDLPIEYGEQGVFRPAKDEPEPALFAQPVHLRCDQ